MREFGKAARPGKGEYHKITCTYVGKKEKTSGEIFSLLTFVAIHTYSASCYILTGNDL
jgi:hypothetical protein